MGVKVGPTCLHLRHSSVPHSASSQTRASTISLPSLSRRASSEGALVLRFHRLERSTLFGTKLHRSRSCGDKLKSRPQTIKRACSASLDAFSDEEFSKKIEELAMRFQLSDDDDDENMNSSASEPESEMVAGSTDIHRTQNGISQDLNFAENKTQFTSPKLDPVEPPDWSVQDEIIPASIERKANSVDLPLSLRIIKRKKQWQEGIREAGESAYCSVKKAFSSMVFIIRELHSFTLQMREMLLYEDLQGILVRVQKEMHASFVWLFQQVFSHTPTLMVYVMILLANYSVYSMASSTAIAAAPPAQCCAAATESSSMAEDQSRRRQEFDSSAIKSFSVSSSSGKTTSIGGNNGGGGTLRPVSHGTDGDGWFDGSKSNQGMIIPDGVSSITRTSEDESVSGQEEETSLWNSVVHEAARMESAFRDEALDHETAKSLVSPVTAEIEADDYADFFRTELLYQTGLAQEPNNTLLLANYAQFLYVVARDYDRAEEYFRRAVKVEPADAEALSKYAGFLWRVRKDMWGAEETYLEAIAADPNNPFHAANYAHFLWSTGAEDTCYPIGSPDDSTEDV